MIILIHNFYHGIMINPLVSAKGLNRKILYPSIITYIYILNVFKFFIFKKHFLTCVSNFQPDPM